MEKEVFIKCGDGVGILAYVKVTTFAIPACGALKFADNKNEIITIDVDMETIATLLDGVRL